MQINTENSQIHLKYLENQAFEELNESNLNLKKVKCDQFKQL